MSKVRLAAVLVLVCLCRAQAPGPAAAKCRIAGQVVHFTAGTPLGKVQLRLKRFSAENGVMGAPSVSNYAATSDAQGKFSFDDVAPGAYWLYADRTGYLEQSYGAREPFLRGSPLKLAPGQRREDLVLKLTPQSFLYGKVADEDGDLIANSQVLVYRASWARGRRRFEVAGSTTSQDDGSFVIGNLGPGRYYLSAAPARRDDDLLAGDPKAPQTYSTTYYPGVADSSGAAPVDLAAGAEVRGLEIRLRLARTFRIRGKAINTSAGGPAVQAYLKLTAREESSAPGHMEIGVMTGADGAFEFKDLAPGDYVIGAAMSMTFISLMGAQPPVEVKPASGALIGRTAVHLGEEDLDNVVVPLGEGALVTGTIRRFGADPTGPLQWPALMLSPANGLSDEPTAAQVVADGAFRVQHVIPDHYAIQMDNMPPGVYVKSVRFEGHEIAGDDLDLTSGGGLLEIALSPGGGAITGVVRGADGEAAAGATVQVCFGDDTVKYVGADENGEYKVDGLAPGDYRVLAWEEVEAGLSQDPAFRARFDAQSAAVTLPEHGRLTVDLKLIAREAIEAETAKLK